MQTRLEPPCPYFGVCGGCAYQDLPYEEELHLKENNLRLLLQKELGLAAEVFADIVASPEPYGYRSRLDLSFRRMRGGTQLGFMSEGTRRHIAIESCAIARPEISAFLPSLKELAAKQLPENYRSANLVIKTGENRQVRWGGIGRKSLRLDEPDYFWTEIEGKKIFYSLDTFFQANLGILPRLIKKIRSLLDLTPDTTLLDLYAGVGLFWVLLAAEVRTVWAVEENGSSMRVAEFNRSHHNLSNVFLKVGKTEDCLEEILTLVGQERTVAIVDPPRKGLAPLALEKLAQAKCLHTLIYVSCHPPSLVRDLDGFLKAGWEIDQVVPFDLFPRTRHLETLVRLRPEAT